MLRRENVHALFRNLGFDVVRHPRRNSHQERSYSARRARWLTSGEHSVVLDVGANVGHYGLELRQLEYTGRIVSFEPQNSAFAELKRASALDPNWHVIQAAVGESESTIEFNISGDSQCSSILPMDHRHLQAHPASAYVGTERVRVAALDTLRSELLTDADNVWLKMDVQGYEMNVLRGAKNTLAQVSTIEMELSVVTLYGGSALLTESLELMSRWGYGLIAMEEMFWDEHTGHVLALNGIFRRADRQVGDTTLPI
jgi:FkbM family methyltransferase